MRETFVAFFRGVALESAVIWQMRAKLAVKSGRMIGVNKVTKLVKHHVFDALGWQASERARKGDTRARRATASEAAFHSANVKRGHRAKMGSKISKIASAERVNQRKRFVRYPITYQPLDRRLVLGVREADGQPLAVKTHAALPFHQNKPSRLTEIIKAAAVGI